MLEKFHAKRPLFPLVGFLCSALALIVGMLYSKSLMIFPYIAVLAVLFAAFGLWRAVLGAAVMMGLFGVLTGVLSCLTAGSFDSFFETLGRCLLLGVAAAPMLSIPAAQMTRCLRQMKCPGAITLGILVTIRFIPVLLSEVRQISEAMKTRGVRTAWYRPGTVYRAFFIPLTMRVINISDSLSLSLETRGFAIENKEAAVFRPVRFRLRDALFAVGTAAASVGLAVMV